MNFHQEIVKLLVKKTKLPVEEVNNLLTVPPNSKMGDYAFPCFKLNLEGNPKEKAEILKSKFKKLPGFISKTEVAGPYLNFYLDQTLLAESTLTKIRTEKNKYGQNSLGKGKTVVID